MLLSTASASKGLVSRAASCVPSIIHQRKSIFQISGANVSSPLSSYFSSSSNKDEQAPFRPRRRPPKSFVEAPKPKVRSKKAKAPIRLTKSVANETIESKYGHGTAAAIRHLRRTKEEKGAINNDTVFRSAEETMRAADYLTADAGSTEDLVGERRAMMDAWDADHAENFKKQLEEIMEEQSEFAFQDLPWKEDEKKDSDGSFDRGSSSQGNNEGEDPNQKAFGPWSETIIRVDRVQKVQRGGTMIRYRALVVGGNLNGCAGFGIAKGNAPNEAAMAAARIAKRNLFFVDRYLNTGLTTDLAGRHNSCKVTLRSVNPNRGLHGHPLILEILKYFGITDCSAKSHGNRNVFNVVYATFKAIMIHESLEDIALKRGKRLLSMERARRLNI